MKNNLTIHFQAAYNYKMPFSFKQIIQWEALKEIESGRACMFCVQEKNYGVCSKHSTSGKPYITHPNLILPENK